MTLCPLGAPRGFWDERSFTAASSFHTLNSVSTCRGRRKGKPHKPDDKDLDAPPRARIGDCLPGGASGDPSCCASGRSRGRTRCSERNLTRGSKVIPRNSSDSLFNSSIHLNVQ